MNASMDAHCSRNRGSTDSGPRDLDKGHKAGCEADNNHRCNAPVAEGLDRSMGARTMSDEDKRERDDKPEKHPAKPTPTDPQPTDTQPGDVQGPGKGGGG